MKLSTAEMMALKSAIKDEARWTSVKPNGEVTFKWDHVMGCVILPHLSAHYEQMALAVLPEGSEIVSRDFTPGQYAIVVRLPEPVKEPEQVALF